MRLRLLLRQATSSLGASIAIALIVAVAAGLFTAWPRLARATFVEEFNYRIAQTAEPSRALNGRQVGGWPVSSWSGNTSLTPLQEELQKVVDGAGPTLRPLLGRAEILVTLDANGTALTMQTDAPRPPDLAGLEMRFRALPGLEEHVRIAGGDAPDVWGGPTTSAEGQVFDGIEPIPVMFSVATAERLGLEPGDVIELPDITLMWDEDGPVSLTAVVSGTFEALDPDDGYWEHQVSGLDPLIRHDGNIGDFAIGAAYIHPDTLGKLDISGNLRPRTDVWIPVRPGSDDASALLDDLLEITAREIPLGDQTFGGVRIELETALIDVLRTSLIAQRGTAAVLTLVAAGPVGVTFALLALATRLSVTRGRDTLALASARGGSPPQIRGALGLEGVVLGLPAAAVGAAVATLAIPGALQAGDYVLALLAGLAPAVFLAGASLPNLRTERHDLTGRSPSRWRWVVETLVVAVAAGAAYLLLSRGLQATTTTTVDPLATATPLLISLAAAVLATRAFPYPMRLVNAVSRRRRDLAPFLGSARAIREGGAGLVPMLALLVATSIAMFSTTMISTLSTGVGESTRADTGADIRIVGPAYSDDVIDEIASLPEVAAVARVFTQPSTRFTEATTTRPVVLYAVDTATLASVQVDVVGAVTLPAGMDALVDGRVPILTSSALGAGDGDMSVQMNDVVDVELVGTASEAAGIAESALWAVVDLELMREVSGQNLVPRMALVGLRPGASPDDAAAAISEIVEGVGTVATAQAEESGFLDSPSARSMQQGFLVALALSVLQSVLALVLTLVLAAPARGRLVAVLRTLGIEPREARRLVAWELVPLAAAALAAGTVLGLALPHLVVATVDLSPFTGLSSPTVVYDWSRLALVLAGVVAVVGITLVVASTIARRLSLSVLRIGDAT